jgi:hypothetical protein
MRKSLGYDSKALSHDSSELDLGLTVTGEGLGQVAKNHSHNKGPNLTRFDKVLPSFGDIARDIRFFKLLGQECVVVTQGQIDRWQMEGLNELCG